MKKILFLALLAPIWAFAFSLDPFHVTLTDERESFILSVVTAREQTSICPLIIDEMRIKVPNKENGRIELNIITDPNGIHLWAFGKRSGKFSFSKGSKAPAIVPGVYDLILNGFPYGQLIIDTERRACLQTAYHLAAS
jgi:hypothetical protein